MRPVVGRAAPRAAARREEPTRRTHPVAASIARRVKAPIAVTSPIELVRKGRPHARLAKKTRTAPPSRLSAARETSVVSAATMATASRSTAASGPFVGVAGARRARRTKTARSSSRARRVAAACARVTANARAISCVARARAAPHEPLTLGMTGRGRRDRTRRHLASVAQSSPSR